MYCQTTAREMQRSANLSRAGWSYGKGTAQFERRSSSIFFLHSVRCLSLLHHRRQPFSRIRAMQYGNPLTLRSAIWNASVNLTGDLILSTSCTVRGNRWNRSTFFIETPLNTRRRASRSGMLVLNSLHVPSRQHMCSLVRWSQNSGLWKRRFHAGWCILCERWALCLLKGLS